MLRQQLQILKHEGFMLREDKYLYFKQITENPIFDPNVYLAKLKIVFAPVYDPETNQLLQNINSTLEDPQFLEDFKVELPALSYFFQNQRAQWNANQNGSNRKFIQRNNKSFGSVQSITNSNMSMLSLGLGGSYKETKLFLDATNAYLDEQKRQIKEINEEMGNIKDTEEKKGQSFLQQKMTAQDSKNVIKRTNRWTEDLKLLE
ncbi:Hypothetical_protein [Hexamita inflata]|uniref:Hypothetical_protein n=1 Tax=Hexamita inflata TaxID=28002 RepID=A0ABP1GV64_9EUKA